ncbi:MAG: QueT transporter family protein [Clostridia bacterium]|nr:QueT transporter family protein [Clostridia bacterium]
MNKSTKNTLKYISQAAVIAALYVALSYMVFPLASGAIQFRISEALCILAVFTPAAIPGMAIGCFLFNLISGCVIYDVIFGSLATLVGVLFTRVLKKLPLIAPAPYVLANIVTVPLVLQFAYGLEDRLAWLFLTVGIGEILSAWVCGIMLWFAVRKTKIFR